MSDEPGRKRGSWRWGTTAAFAVALTLLGAQVTEARSKAAAHKTAPWEGEDEAPATTSKAATKGDDGASTSSSKDDEDRDSRNRQPAKAAADETGDDMKEAAAPHKAAPPPPAAAPKVPSMLSSGEPGWQMGFYGWLELDAIWDSTQSFNETVLDQNIARRETYAGSNPRFQATPKDSRLGFKVSAPDAGSIKASAQFEADFFGVQPTTVSQDQQYTYSSIRLRQYFAKLETPIVDVLAGQTFDLYGWGGQGFFPSTPAFLGVMGEVFHRNVQLRLSKTIGGSAAAVDIAVAGVRPATRDAAVPDVQAGLKFSLKNVLGASAQGPRPAKAAPLSFGVSGVGRRMAVTDFQAITADAQIVYGYGGAADLFVPIIPVHADDLSNGLSLTAEYSRGTGVSDLYLTLTGGVLFPSLPNAKNVLPALTYTPNIDPGIVTFDQVGKARTINWQGWMVNLHYNFPFNKGKTLALSGTYSEIRSNNDLALTPVQGRLFVWDRGRYLDGTLWWSITPAFQMCLSFQSETQRLGDDSVGGATVARNNRAEAAWWFFF